MCQVPEKLAGVIGLDTKLLFYKQGMQKTFDPAVDCFMHWIGKLPPAPYLWNSICNGSVVTRPSRRHDLWPPNILFEIAYACAIIEQFGADEFVSYCSMVFPEPGHTPITSDEDEDDTVKMLPNLTKINANKTSTKQTDAALVAALRNPRSTRRNEGMLDWYDLLSLGPAEIINRPKIMKRKAELEKIRREEERKRTHGKVARWLEGSA